MTVTFSIDSGITEDNLTNAGMIWADSTDSGITTVDWTESGKTWVDRTGSRMTGAGSVGSRTGVGSGADSVGSRTGASSGADSEVDSVGSRTGADLTDSGITGAGLTGSGMTGAGCSKLTSMAVTEAAGNIISSRISAWGVSEQRALALLAWALLPLRIQGQEVVGSPTSWVTWSDINTGLSRLDMTDSNLTWTDLTDTGTEVDWETSLWETFSSIISEDLVDSGMTEGSSTDSEAGAGTELLSGPGAGTEDSLADATTRATLFLLFLRFSLGVRRWSWTWLGGRRAWWSTQT